uniref:Uncharacterized protein n=1 Tax=Hyaloperonospora arabidopsidis (strain Emoy2) TaxID=559515 RepID=M4BKN2_HYAAE
MLIHVSAVHRSSPTALGTVRTPLDPRHTNELGTSSTASLRGDPWLVTDSSGVFNHTTSYTCAQRHGWPGWISYHFEQRAVESELYFRVSQHH